MVLGKCTERVNQLSSLHKSRQPPATGRNDTEMENSIYLPPLQTHLFLYKHGTNYVCELLCFQQITFYQASPTSPLVWPIFPAQSETCSIPTCILGCNLTSCKGTKTVRASLRQRVVRRIRKSLPLPVPTCRHPLTHDIFSNSRDTLHQFGECH